MVVQKSPGGSIFPYYFKGGELFGLHLGSFAEDENGVIALMKAEGEFILAQHRKMGLWIDFYETKLTPRVIAALVEMVVQVRPRITKLGIVGCSWLSKRRINREMRSRAELGGLPLKFTGDPEEAKTWLVGELDG
jgi:hypothetical protein